MRSLMLVNRMMAQQRQKKRAEYRSNGLLRAI
jgi:hypothetical protein